MACVDGNQCSIKFAICIFRQPQYKRSARFDNFELEANTARKKLKILKDQKAKGCSVEQDSYTNYQKPNHAGRNSSG